MLYSVRCIFAVLAASLLLGACALSPQTIEVRPKVDLSTANPVGQNTTVTVQVTDSRPSRTIGVRGGVYKDTATISTAPDIHKPIRAELVRGLQALGYEVVEAGTPAKADLRVKVDSIEYTATGQRVLRSIETAATMRAVCRVGNREFTGRYRGTQTREVLTKPSPDDNEEMLNMAISRVLERMLTDRELLDFMRDG